MLDLGYNDSRKLDDGTVVSVSSCPNLLIVTTPDGVQTNYEGDDFDTQWETCKKLFNTSAPAGGNGDAPTGGATNVDEKDKGGVAKGPIT